MNVSDLAADPALAKTSAAKTRMSPERTSQARLNDVSDVSRLGAALAQQLRRGDIILLEGDLGAGKTELARAIIHARMGGDVEVPSPTFTLVQTYETPGLMITHADLYRIERIADLSELGLEEAMENGALLVEWPGRAKGLWPVSRLEISLTLDGEGPARWATCQGYGDWRDRLSGAMA